jgi:hypothetical protein
VLTLLPRVASAAAEDCLAEPTSDKLDGQHWYYRFDRNSNRRCWYLKDTTGNAKDATKDTNKDIAPRQSSSRPTSAWDFGQSTPPKFAPRRGDDAAKAQFGTGTTSLVRARPAVASFDDNLRRDMPPAPWQPPQTQLLDSADIDTPSSAASLTTAGDPATEVNPAAAAMAADASGSAKPVKPTAPIHKLLMVVIGALSLSGLVASAQYRLSKAGRARRRERNWQRAIVRARRNRDKPRNKKIVHAGSRAGRAAKPAAVAAAPAVRINPAPPPANAVAAELPAAIVVSPAKIPDPAVERADLMAARARTSPAKLATAAKAAPQPAVAPVPPHPIEAARAAEKPAAQEIADPAAELVDLLGAHAAKKAVRQPEQTSRPAAKAAPAPQPPAEAALPPLPRIEDPEAELASLLESRFAPPAAPPVRHTTDRSKDRPNPTPPVAPVAPAARKVVDPITELADLLEAKESKRAARLANAAAPRQEKNPPVVSITPPVAQPVDPAAELFGMLEAHAAKSAPPAPEPRPSQAPQPVGGTRPIREPRRIEETRPVQTAQPAPTVQRSKTAQQPPKAATPRRKKPSPAPAHGASRADIAPAKTVVRAPAHAEPIGRAAAPKSGKSDRLGNPAGKEPRRRNADLRPLPPALMETPNHDGPTPPLDFIPRPQALRPRMQDIRQDESLDGVQDILARLARHG